MLEFLYRLISKYIIGVDPLVFQVWIPLPLDKILQFLPPAEVPLVQNLLDFIFFFAIYQFGRWALIVAPMRESLTIRCEKVCVKNGVYAPLHGKFETVIDVRHHLD